MDLHLHHITVVLHLHLITMDLPVAHQAEVEEAEVLLPATTLLRLLIAIIPLPRHPIMMALPLDFLSTADIVADLVASLILVHLLMDRSEAASIMVLCPPSTDIPLVVGEALAVDLISISKIDQAATDQDSADEADQGMTFMAAFHSTQEDLLPSILADTSQLDQVDSKNLVTQTSP